MPKRKQGEVDNQGVQDFELIELLIRESVKAGPSTSAPKGSDFESFKARFQSYVDQIPSYLHSVGKEGFFPHFFLGSFSTLIDTEIATKLDIEKIYFSFDSSKTLKVAVIKKGEIKSPEDAADKVRLFVIAESGSTKKKFSYGELDKILGNTKVARNNVVRLARDQGKLGVRLVEITKEKDAKGKMVGISVNVESNKLDNDASTTHEFKEIKKGLWSNPESDITQLTSLKEDIVKNTLKKVLEKISKTHSQYNDSLVYGKEVREAAHHGFVAGALVNFRYRHNLRVYLEQFAGRGYADIVLVPRGKDRSLNAVPIIIELKAGTAAGTTPGNALEQAKDYAKGFQPNTVRVLTISDNVLCVGLNLDSTEGEKFSIYISPLREREPAPPIIQKLLEVTSSWSGEESAIADLKKEIKQPLDRIYHTFPGTPEKGGNYFSRFLLGQLLLADRFVDINLEKSIFLYNEYPLASSTRSGAQSTERPVTTFMLTKGNQGQDKEVFIFHIREGGKGEFSEKKIPIDLSAFSKITEVCISLQEERKSDFFDVEKVNRYNSLNEYKGGKESFNGKWKNIPYPAELKETFDKVLESQLASSQDQSQSIGKYKELFGKLGEAMLPFKDLIEKEAHTQAVFHGVFSHYSDIKLGEPQQEDRALILTEFQTGRGKRIDMLVHGVKFVNQASSAKGYDPVGLEVKGPREGKAADALITEANDQITKEYTKGVTYKTLTDGNKVLIMEVVFDAKARSSDSLLKVTDKFYIANVMHSSKVKGNINKLKRPALHKLFNRKLNALRSFKVHSGGTISNWVDIGRDRLKDSNKNLINGPSNTFLKSNHAFQSYLNQIPEDISTLDLSEMDLGNFKMVILSNFLRKYKNINSIDLSYNGFSSVQVSGLISFLMRNNRKISFLDLSQNDIGSNGSGSEAIESLARLIETNNIDSLTISDIGMESDDFSKIFRALKKNTSIKSLDCSLNKVAGGFNQDDIKTIVDFLYNHPKLTALNLANTGVNDRIIKGIEEEVQKDYQGKTLFIEKLDIGNYNTEEEITKEGIKSLAKLLKQASKLKSFRLSGNPIRVEGLKELVSALRNTGIETLDISETSLECNQDNAKSVADIMKGLIGELNLRELNLSDNQLNAKAIREIFSSMKNRKEQVLKELDLASNFIEDKIGYETLEAISSSLQNNDVLESLNLASMDLSSTDIEEIVGALRKETIVDLDISGNDIHGSTMQELSEFLQDNSRLRFLNIANYNSEKIPLLEGIENLFQTLRDHNKVLTHLNIESYALSDKSVNIIAKYLGSDIGIQYLSLAGSKFTGDKERALNVLFEALKNSNLQLLDVRGISITDRVIDKIIECLEVNENLQVLRISQNQLSKNQVERLERASLKTSVQVEPRFLANSGCPQRVKREIGNILCVDSRDEEKITEEKKERLIKELFGIDNVKDLNAEIEAYGNEIIAVDSKRVHTTTSNSEEYRTEVYVTVRDDNGNDKKLIMDDVARMRRITNYEAINNDDSYEIWLRDGSKHYVITEKMEGQNIEYYLGIDGYKVKLDSIIKDFTADAEKKAIHDKLHQLSNKIELYENKKYIEDIGGARDIEVTNQDYDHIINEIKQNLLKKGVSENAFDQFKSHFDDLNEKVFAEYIGNVEGNLKKQRIEFDHNKFDSAKIKGAKGGKFFSLMAIYDLFDSIGDTATLGRYDNDALKRVFGINGILDAMDDVRTSVSISHTSKVGKLISKIPQPVRQTFVKVISNPVVRSITFATIAYQFGYSINEITQGNHHPLNYYWTASSGVKLASMSIRPVSTGINFAIKSVSTTTKILRGLSATSKILGRVAVVTMVADVLVTIGVEIHERMEYTKAIAEQVPLLPGNEQAEVFFAKMIKFFTGRDVEKEYGDIIRAKGYLNYVKEVAIKLLDDNYNIAAIVQYVISIEEKYSEVVKTVEEKHMCVGQGLGCFDQWICGLEKKYNNISFDKINAVSNIKNDLSLLNISKALEMRPYTLVVSEGWERFICNVKSSSQCHQDIDQKEVYIVNTDAKHIPHLTKYEYEDLGLRIVNAPLKKLMQESQCSNIINEERVFRPYALDKRNMPCNAERIHRNCQKTFALSGEPFIFTNPTRKDPYHIRKETFPKDSVLYISGPRILTAATNYPAVMYIPDGYVQYVGSKNNKTIFIIDNLASGTLEGGVEKENVVVMNVKTNNVVADLHNGTIHYGSTNYIKLTGIYNYVSNSDSKQNITTHCRTKLINAKNAEVQQNSFNCTDKDYEVRVVNKEDVHHRGLKQTIFIVNENSDNAKIVSDFNYTEKIKKNVDVIDTQVADITWLKVGKSIEGSGYNLDLLSDRTQNVVSSIKIDSFKNLIIQAKRLGIIESIIVQDKSLSDMVEDAKYQKLNDLGKDIDEKIMQNSEKKLKAVIQVSILDFKWANIYQIAKGIANYNNLGIPVSQIEVVKNYMGVPNEKTIIADMYSDQIIVDFGYNNSNFIVGGTYYYYRVVCNYYQDITVEGRKGQDQYVVKLPEYNHILQQEDLRLSIELDLNLKIKNKAVLYQNIPDDIIDLTALNVADVNSINVKKGRRSYFNKCDKKQVSDLTVDSLEIKDIKISISKGVRWSLSIGLVDYFRGPEYQSIVLRINNKFYKINNANLKLEPAEVNTKPFKYYQPGEQELQIYHNQPINKNIIGLVDLKEKSILDFDVEIVGNGLLLLHKNNTITKVENWDVYQPARKMIFAFNDTIVSDSNCIAFTCNSNDIIEAFNKAKETILKEQLFNAIKQDNINEVKSLIRRIADNVDVDIEGKHELISLHIAIQEGRLDVVKLLFNRGSVNVEDKDIHGYSPLHWAAQEGKLNIAEFLVDKGANIEYRSKDGSTPADLAKQKGYTYIVNFLKQVQLDKKLLIAAGSGDLDEVKDLVKQGADLGAKNNNGIMFLHYASLSGQVDAVKYCTENGINLEAKDNSGKTPLHYASVRGQVDVVEYFIKNGANLEAKDMFDMTPLHYASWNGHADVVEYLIKEGANLETKDSNGRTPLHYASLGGYSEVVEYLVRNEASLEAQDKSGKTPLDLANREDYTDIVKFLRQAQLDRELLIAVKNNDLDKVKGLIENGASLEAKDENSKTSLHYFAYEGNLNIFEFLANKGANIEAKDLYGWTPLCYAVYKNNSDILKFLLDKGADIEAKDINDETPLHIAVKDNNNPEVIRLLLDNGARIEAKNKDGWTPLHYAAYKDNLDACKLLLERNADVEAKNTYDETPLHVAAKNSNKSKVTVELLLDTGANINAKNKDGWVPLHYAAYKDNLDTCKLLLERGASIEAKTNDDRTPLDIANYMKHSDVVEYLKKVKEERGKPVQRRRRHHHGDHNRHHGHLSRKPLAIDSSNQPEIAASSNTRPSSWINDLFGWVKSSVSGLLGSKSKETSSTASPISQVDAKMDVNGTIMLLDVLVRKVTGQKYIFTSDQNVSLLEAQGYALNITEKFEKVVEQAALKSGISMHRLNIDFMEIQKEVTGKIMSGKFDEISGILNSYVEKGCPGREAEKLSSKKFDKFMIEFNSRLNIVLNQSIQQILHSRDSTLEVDGAKKQQMNLEPQSYLSNASVQGHLTRDKVKLIS